MIAMIECIDVIVNMIECIDVIMIIKMMVTCDNENDGIDATVKIIEKIEYIDVIVKMIECIEYIDAIVKMIIGNDGIECIDIIVKIMVLKMMIEKLNVIVKMMVLKIICISAIVRLVSITPGHVKLDRLPPPKVDRVNDNPAHYQH